MSTYKISISDVCEQLEQRVKDLKKDKSAALSSRKVVDKALKSDTAYYGVNTGFGALARKRIEADDINTLQDNMLLSHALGVGELLPYEISRLMLLLKIHCLGLGYSGVSLGVIDRLIAFVEKDLIPAVPSKGSLGASGDLAPLAHMSLPLIGEGLFWDKDKQSVQKASKLLAKHKLKTLRLEAKDALALCNGTQMMSAFAIYVLLAAQKLLKTADILSSISLEAANGSSQPFDKKIHELRPFKGQKAVAQNMRKLLSASKIIDSHADCDRVQDPYSIRCIPQVHGASRDALQYLEQVVEIEINSVTDNPLVFENGDILSGGNFHGQPLALALDFAAMALAELGSISERRIYLLLKGHRDLPKLLMEDTGINSGYMISQYTAASLVAENKVLCHPASVDSIPTSLGQEDHVSMGGLAATKLHKILANVEKILAIEALTSTQALDFIKPVRPGKGVEAAYKCIRKDVPFRDKDVLLGADLDACIELVHSHELLSFVESKIGVLH